MSFRSIFLACMVALGAAWAPPVAAEIYCVAYESDLVYGDVTLPVGPQTTTSVADVYCWGTSNGDRRRDVRLCIGLNTPQSPRVMSNGASSISHRIYRDPSYVEEINYTDINAEEVVSMPNSLSFSTQLSFYGRLSGSSPSPTPGTYSDAVNGAFGWSTRDSSCSTVPAYQAINFTARSRVAAACTVVANDIAFGTHNTLASAVSATSSIGVVCTATTPYNVRMDGGTTANNVANRRMGLNGTGPAAQGVAYQLRHTSPNGPLWGDGTSGTSTLAGTGTGGSQTLPVYGRVLPQAVPLPGQYEDTVTVTVQY